MNSLFLRAKHWQIFVPLLVIPFITMIIFSMIVAFVIITDTPERPEDGIWVAYFMPLIILICSLVQFGWFWSVLTKLGALIPHEVRMPIKRMKLFFFIPLIYFCLIPLFVAFVITNVAVAEHHPSAMIQVAVVGIFIFFLHLFSIFCIFHTIYFAAKTIRSAELQRNTTFSDFTGDFFLIWFFPVGVWFIQPRINKLIQEANGITSIEGLVDQM